MKCWVSNKRNPINKVKNVNLNDFEYGTINDVYGTFAATTAIVKQAKKRKFQNTNNKEHT